VLLFPIHVLLESVLFSPELNCPINILLPPKFVLPAYEPIAVLFVPVILSTNEQDPIATFALVDVVPTFVFRRELIPIATLNDPVLFAHNEFSPIATLAEPDLLFRKEFNPIPIL
jgi:hypothetical protein